MKKYAFTSFVLLTSISFQLFAAPDEKPAGKTGPTPVVVAYFSPTAKTQFDSKIKPQFAKLTALCGTCQILDLTPVDEKGEFAPDKMESVLKALPENVKILFFDFNLKRGAFSEPTMALLNKASTEGPLVLASAGIPKANETSSPLNKTVFGQVQEAIIIGELEDRDRLPPQGFFGPEMYTAVRPPKDLQNQSLGPMIFVSKLAANYSRRSATEWVAYFKMKKAKNRKIWLEVGDLF